jgi:hypothetical protein
MNLDHNRGWNHDLPGCGSLTSYSAAHIPVAVVLSKVCGNRLKEEKHVIRKSPQ